MTSKVTATPNELAELYLQGYNYQQIADKYGVSKQRIYQIFKRNGFIVKDEQDEIKIKREKYKKYLANEVLIASTNRAIEKVYKERNQAKHNLLAFKIRRKQENQEMVALINNMLNFLEKLDLKENEDYGNLKEILLKQRKKFELNYSIKELGDEC